MDFVIGVLVGGIALSVVTTMSMAKAAKICDECECRIIQRERENNDKS